MKTTIRKMGNSHGVIIPKALINQLGFNDCVEMSVVDGTIVLSKPKPAVRKGWAAAAEDLAQHGEDGLTWENFREDEVVEWRW